MKTKLLNILILKRNSSIYSNLKPFLRKRPKNKTFWYFHESEHFREMTFRNEKCDQKSENDISRHFRKQLSDSIIRNSKHVLSDNVLHEYPLKTKLFVLDALSVIHGTDHKQTVNFFDSLRPLIIFELQKQNIFVLMHLLYLSSVIKTENTDDFGFLVSKLINRFEEHFLKEHPIGGQLCSTDIAVLCHSLFRLKTKFKDNSILSIFSDIVSEDIKSNRLKRTHILSIVKYMRFNRFKDQQLVEALKVFIQINSNKLSFTECVHYLAFFANISLYDRNIYRLLVDERSNQLFKIYSLESDPQVIRTKDLARFLWSVSSVNHKLSEFAINWIIEQMERLLSSDFTTYPHFLIDCFKSLLILGIYPQKLLSQTLDSKQWTKLILNSDRNKVSKDLYFILESIAIERPDIRFERRTLIYSMAKETKHSISLECKDRPKLLQYFNWINQNHNQNGVESELELSYTLSHIGIASLVFRGMCLEVIDRTVADDSNHLNGLMSTKIRQMSAKNIRHLLIYNLNELKQYLTTI